MCFLHNYWLTELLVPSQCMHPGKGHGRPVLSKDWQVPLTRNRPPGQQGLRKIEASVLQHLAKPLPLSQSKA